MTGVEGGDGGLIPTENIDKRRWVLVSYIYPLQALQIPQHFVLKVHFLPKISAICETLVV